MEETKPKKHRNAYLNEGSLKDLEKLNCCPDGPPPLYRDDDATNPDIWDAPTTYKKKGGIGRFSEESRYRLHERKFFHAMGIHNDAIIADRLGMSPVAMLRLLATAHLPAEWGDDNPEKKYNATKNVNRKKRA